MSQNTNWRGRKRTYLIDENTSSRSSGSSSTDQASPANDSTEILTIVYWTFLALSNCVLIVQMNVFRLNLVTPSLVTSSNCMVQKELNGERYNVRVIQRVWSYLIIDRMGFHSWIRIGCFRMAQTKVLRLNFVDVACVGPVTESRATSHRRVPRALRIKNYLRFRQAVLPR
ncbi:hypothetical protein ABG067_006051 [Albugo candida]